MTAHGILILTHTISGIVSFVTGAALITPPLRYGGNHPIFRLYYYSLIVMTASLTAAVFWDFSQLALTEKATFSGLTLLALYMNYRAGKALKAGTAQLPRWQLRFIDDIGFTLISLFDGFVIVSALDTNLSGWIVAAVAVFGVAAGILVTNAIKNRVEHAI